MTNKNKSHSTRAEASRKIVYQPPNYLEAPKPNVDGIKYRWVRGSAGGEDDSQIPTEMSDAKKEYFEQKTHRQSEAVDADILKQQHPSMPVHQKRSSSTTTGKRKTEFSEE